MTVCKTMILMVFFVHLDPFNNFAIKSTSLIFDILNQKQHQLIKTVAYTMGGEIGCGKNQHTTMKVMVNLLPAHYFFVTC